MRVMEQLKNALGGNVERYEVVADLAGGCFGLMSFFTCAHKRVFFIKDRNWMYEDIKCDFKPSELRCVMDRLVNSVVSEFMISSNEVEMRLALRGGEHGLG